MIEVPNRKYQVGRWQVDCAQMTIASEEKSIQLSAKVFEILKLFIISDEHIVSKDHAIEVVWLGNEGVGKTGFTNSVWQLRKAFTDLGADNDEVFATIQKVGYRMLVDIEAIEVDKTAPVKNKTNLKVALFSAAIIATVAILSFMYVSIFESDEEVQKVVKKSTHLTNFEGIETQPDVSHDGNFLAFVWRAENKNHAVYIKNLQDSEAPLRKLTQNNLPEVAPVWSPSGKEIAYQTSSNEGRCSVNIFNLISNEVRTIDENCLSSSDSHPIDWSQDGKTLIYNKMVDKGAAIFSYDLATGKSTQISSPKQNQQDVSTIFVENDNRIAVIRRLVVGSEIILIDRNSPDYSETTLVKYQDRALSMAWHESKQTLLVTKPSGGIFVIVSLDLHGTKESLIDESPIPGSIALNQQTNELVISRHYSNEHVEEVDIERGKVLRRVTSSSRDMYGNYINKDGSILFASNRSGNWEIWLRSQYLSKQLTKDIGKIGIPTVSPSGESFAFRLVPNASKKAVIYIANIDGSKKTILDDIDMPIQSTSWSRDENRLYFSGFKDDQWGIYQYDLETKNIEQITNSGESFVVEGDDGHLYMARFEQNGIWQYNLQGKSFRKVNEQLQSADYGNMFWVDGHLHYLRRSQTADELVRLEANDIANVILSFKLGSIRSYRGISPAAKGNMLISRHGVNDADLYSIPL